MPCPVGMVPAHVLDNTFVKYLTARRCSFVAVGQPFRTSNHMYSWKGKVHAPLTQTWKGSTFQLR
jgi:hypothetical protein